MKTLVKSDPLLEQAYRMYDLFQLAQVIWEDMEINSLSKAFSKDIAENMLREGIDVPFISRVTGLKISVIEQLK